jgi:hypothetical protein
VDGEGRGPAVVEEGLLDVEEGVAAEVEEEAVVAVTRRKSRSLPLPRN